VDDLIFNAFTFHCQSFIPAKYVSVISKGNQLNPHDISDKFPKKIQTGSTQLGSAVGLTLAPHRALFN